MARKWEAPPAREAERVNPGDFVLKLSDVVEHPDAALEDYVVTDQLARCFDEALGLVESAVTSRESKARAAFSLVSPAPMTST